MPRPNHTGVFGVPSGKVSVVKGFTDGGNQIFEYPYAISGVTRDASGAPLPGVLVKMFDTNCDVKINEATSRADGTFTTPASNLLNYYLRSYLPGSPDVAGASVNTLKGT
jgi:hypothetical protein